MGTTVAGISTVGFGDKRTQSAMHGMNPENFNVIITGHLMRPPNRLIYIHSVAKRSFLVQKKTFFPRLVLAGCEHGERYVTCGVIPDPISQPSPDETRGGTRIDEHDGWRVAIDLLNVTNLTSNPFSGDNNPNFYANTNGLNYIAEGLWPSLNKIPDESEIQAAERRRDRHYEYLARESQRLAARSKRDLDEFLQTYPDTHIALDALGIKTEWHNLSTTTVTCSNCGDQITPGIAFHKSSVGILCVIDPMRALKAGAIDRAKFDALTEEDQNEAESEHKPQTRQSRMKPVV
jgi:hypothetical protein